jgi:SAM-dependent methyltransferase
VSTSTRYIGNELDAFALARNWKRYWSRMLNPYAAGRVLEVGAGIGASTRALCTHRASSWVCLEPDPELAARIEEEQRRLPFPVNLDVRTQSIQQLDANDHFDCILYIDVLEHIENDRTELEAAARNLAPGGALVVLAPAHQRFYSEFDRSIGHYRRYDEAMMRDISPTSIRVERIFYLDCAGMMLSWINRHVRRGGSPSKAAVLCWDRCFVPASRLLDPFFSHRVGKTIVAIWRKGQPGRLSSPRVAEDDIACESLRGD